MKPILFNTTMVRAILAGRKTQTRRICRISTVDCKVEHSKCNYVEYPAKNHLGVCANFYHNLAYMGAAKPRYQVGDVLYVRETWGDYRESSEDGEGYYTLYRADFPEGAKTYKAGENEFGKEIICDLPKWHPSIHMPKEVARIFLRITDVRAERIKNISIDDIDAEGIEEEKPKLGSEYLCDYCPLDEPVKGVHCYGREPIMCEGSHCDEAFEAWVEEYKDGFASFWDRTIKSADLDRYGWEANPWVLVYSFERISKEVAFGDKIGGPEADNGVIMPAT